MSNLHPSVTGRKVTDISDPTIAELPPLVSVKQTCAVLNMSRATVWRRVKDGTLQVANGGGSGKKNFVTKASIQRFCPATGNASRCCVSAMPEHEPCGDLSIPGFLRRQAEGEETNSIVTHRSMKHLVADIQKKFLRAIEAHQTFLWMGKWLI
jgi:hypothetical protein